MNHPFEGLGCPAQVPVVAHVPHSGVGVPPAVRASLVLDDAALAQELLRVTDHDTDRLFQGVVRAGGVMFVNRLSRLVVDPERFRSDEDEVMASRGVGAVYRRTCDGRVLRAGRLWDAERERLLSTYYDPYAEALGDLVQQTLDAFGRCLIVDCHSYPLTPFVWELDQDPLHRPPVGLGTDPFHTPERLVAALEAECGRHGIVSQRDRPFGGTYVPAAHFRRDARVSSVMIEVRRDQYLDEQTGERLPAFAQVEGLVSALVAVALHAAVSTG